MTQPSKTAHLKLVHFEFQDDGFAHAMQGMSKLMSQVAETEAAFLGIEQGVLWQEGRLDRHAITRAVMRHDGHHAFAPITALGDALVITSVLAMAISSSVALNQPAWRACEAMAQPSARFSDRGQAEARLLFLPGAMLVVPDDDFALNNAIDKARSARSPAYVGSVWTVAGASNHQTIQGRGAADAARNLTEGLLRADERNISVSVSRRSFPG